MKDTQIHHKLGEKIFLVKNKASHVQSQQEMKEKVGIHRIFGLKMALNGPFQASSIQSMRLRLQQLRSCHVSTPNPPKMAL